MTKKEFMAMSLPYGLKCQFLNSTYDYTPIKYAFEFINNWEKSTPILRPLSMLTDQCLPDCKIPIDEMSEYTGLTYGYNEQKQTFFMRGKMQTVSDVSILKLPLLFIQKLIEWHFDIAGLIEKGEAIPVTEDFNPYK